MKRIGYGQVEPNHLSAQRTGQIYAQLPAQSTITQLENGQFAKYDYRNNEVRLTGDGEWMLVYNEVKVYDTLRETDKDFALIPSNYTDGKIVPRLFKTNIGDIFTTNCLEKAGAKGVETTMADVTLGATLSVNANGFLVAGASNPTGPIFQVVKLYKLADGQDAVKVMRIQ